MSNTRVIGQIAIAISLSLLAGAIFYFGQALTRLSDNLPQTAESVTEISAAVAPIVDYIPAVLKESEAIRQQTDDVVQQTQTIVVALPSVLERVDSVVATVENVRAESEHYLAESAAIRDEVALVRAEVGLVRQDLPAILAELEAYRALVPDILAETQALRAMIDPTLTRVEVLVAEIDETASTAGESAVSGFFTGIIKAPFSLMSDITHVVTPSGKPLSKEQSAYLTTRLQDFVGSAQVGDKENFQMPGSDFAGEVEMMSESIKGNQSCRQIRLTTSTKASDPAANDFDVCRDKNGRWSASQK